MDDNHVSKQKKQGKKAIFIPIIVIVAVLVGGALIAGPKFLASQKSEPQIVSKSTLEKIINVSELSTFTAVYNGIAQVNNEKKPDQIDYYVSYEAKVKAGIDLEQIGISVEEEEKTIQITLPEVHITEVTVDVASLDYIFENDKANTSSVSEAAFKACEADVNKESNQQEAILELAAQNAKNILTALIRPFLEQLDEEYTLVIE